MNLKDEIRKLVELQDIDSRIYELTREKDVTKPVALKEISQSFEEKKEGLAEFEENLKTLQLKKKELEVELASKEETLRKSQGQLLQLKTNKEYQAKLTEIGSHKADISVAEEGLIKILDEVDLAKENFNQAKKTLAEEEKKFKQAEGKISEEIKDIEATLINLGDKRKRIADEIDKKVITSYENSLKKRGGLALAEVRGSNCSVCHMSLPHQKINDIKMYANLVFCENCVRILYISEDIS